MNGNVIKLYDFKKGRPDPLCLAVWGGIGLFYLAIGVALVLKFK